MAHPLTTEYQKEKRHLTAGGDFFMSKRLLCSPDNLYYEALKETIQDHEREAMGIRKKRKAQTKKSKKQGGKR